MDWLRVALTKKVDYGNLPLAMPRPTTPLDNGYYPQKLTRHLPILDNVLQRVQWLLMATHIREVALEPRQDRDTKSTDCRDNNYKGIPELLGSNFLYLIHLGKVASHEDLLPIWKDLSGYLKRQHLTTLQRELNNTSCCLSVRTPIFATSGPLKITLALVFILDHRDDLGMVLHQFGLGEKTFAGRKVLKAFSDQH